MPFLDFVKNRQEQPAAERSQQQMPATRREMYTAQDRHESATRQPLSPDVKAQADQVMETLGKGLSHIRSQFSPASPSEGGHSEPMRQNAFNQDKTAHPLSPTTEKVAKVADKTQSAPDNEPRQAGRHNRATPDEIAASERAPSTLRETANTKQQTSAPKAPQRESGGWER